jgi:gas vesicle protein GvpL/GvpF
MKSIVVGVHRSREDVEPVADVIAVGDLWLSVAGVAADQPLGDRDLLLRVAKIRGELLDRATFIAIRYGFAVSSAAEAEAKCAAHLKRWKALLDENRERVEMTLKVAAETPKMRPKREHFSSGAEYLKALHEATSAVDVDPAFREAAERGMNAVATRWIHRDEKSLELAALVDRSHVDQVRRAGERLKRDFPRVPFLLSGPWPLEIFGDADQQ